MIARDLFTSYETAMQRLLEHLGQDHPRYQDALLFQTRLLENIGQARRYGDTETLRHARAQIVEQVNALALATGGPTLAVDATATGVAAGDAGVDAALRQARAYLALASYEAAAQACALVLNQQPDQPDAHLFAAIALMAGHAPDRLEQTTLQRVEAHLRQATAHNDSPATAWALWGMLRYDTYYVNNLAMGAPSLAEIRQELRRAEPGAIDMHLLGLVKHSRDAETFIGLDR